MTRNYYQVMGLPGKWPPVDFVICNADLDLKAGGVAGGAGQAVRIAIAHKIPVFNIRTWQWIFGSHPAVDEIISTL